MNLDRKPKGRHNAAQGVGPLPRVTQSRSTPLPAAMRSPSAGWQGAKRGLQVRAGEKSSRAVAQLTPRADIFIRSVWLLH